MENFSPRDLRCVGGNRLSDYVAKPSVGMSGGIVVAWNASRWKKIDAQILNYSVSVILEDLNSHWRWVLSGVYGPNADAERESFWQELSGVKAGWNLPWCLMGDFNITRFIEDRNREGVITGHMARFSEWIAAEGLSDISLSNHCYTWSNMRAAPSLARLDRILIDDRWEDNFPSCSLRGLPRVTSDHSPLLFVGGNQSRRSCYFKFENWWLQCENF
ncbi:hypothetical protein QJS10_CPB11g00821 [Acorus calamus]|uniref:Endonuclease/exonuclease/phosphatase domain-containing protein n=1 Tax=Acorus calamus TaxID=4465 RepID=A0AAV9DRV0_ACOCL|nr:hypothetical protein QJS10_CPB11g00821 [Acorus calamus]